MNPEIVSALQRAFETDFPPTHAVAIDGDDAFVLSTIWELYQPKKPEGERHSGWSYTGIFELVPTGKGYCTVKLVDKQSFRYLDNAVKAFDEFAKTRKMQVARNERELREILPDTKPKLAVLSR